MKSIWHHFTINLARTRTTHKGHIVCYFPQDKEWSIFPGVSLIKNSIRIVSCLGKLYFASEFPNNKLICYDSLSNCWTSLPFDERRTLHSIFSNNKGEIFALMSDNESSCPDCVFLFFRGIDSHCRKSHLSYIKKYSPESNSWDTVATFEQTLRHSCSALTESTLSPELLSRVSTRKT